MRKQSSTAGENYDEVKESANKSRQIRPQHWQGQSSEVNHGNQISLRRTQVTLVDERAKQDQTSFPPKIRQQASYSARQNVNNANFGDDSESDDDEIIEITEQRQNITCKQQQVIRPPRTPPLTPQMMASIRQQHQRPNLNSPRLVRNIVVQNSPIFRRTTPVQRIQIVGQQQQMTNSTHAVVQIKRLQNRESMCEYQSVLHQRSLIQADRTSDGSGFAVSSGIVSRSEGTMQQTQGQMLCQQSQVQQSKQSIKFTSQPKSALPIGQPTKQIAIPPTIATPQSASTANKTSNRCGTIKYKMDRHIGI